MNASAPMSDQSLVAFLRWALPRLGMRWRGFRKVRRQVKRRIARRVHTLELAGLDAYRTLLEKDAHSDEWKTLGACCRVTISRFYRDREVWRTLAHWLTASAVTRVGGSMAAWSAGCASGEEPYTLALLAAQLLEPATHLEIVASDVSPTLLARAHAAVYPRATTRELPPLWRKRWLIDHDEDNVRLDASVCARVRFFAADVRDHIFAPTMRFDIVLCRNLAFTYYDAATQQQTLSALLAHLHPGGLLVLGSHEAPPETSALVPLKQGAPIFRRC